MVAKRINLTPLLDDAIVVINHRDMDRHLNCVPRQENVCTQLREYAVRISRERYELRRKVPGEGFRDAFPR
jgi:hypothetical protein